MTGRGQSSRRLAAANMTVGQSSRRLAAANMTVVLGGVKGFEA
jgi:hypothetical protein